MEIISYGFVMVCTLDIQGHIVTSDFSYTTISSNKFENFGISQWFSSGKTQTIPFCHGLKKTYYAKLTIDSSIKRFEKDESGFVFSRIIPSAAEFIWTIHTSHNN